MVSEGLAQASSQSHFRSMSSPNSYASGGPRPAPGTINRLFFEAIERFDREDALMHKVDGQWKSISHRFILQRVRHVALGLSKIGINPGERVAILSENRPEWLIADYACVCSSFTDVPIYPSLPPEQIPHLLNDSAAVAIFVSTPEEAGKIRRIRSEVPQLKWVIGFASGKEDGCDFTLDELVSIGAAADSPQAAAEFRDRAVAVSPDHLLTLVYTSGTTGKPKGVMMTHDNLHSNVAATRQILEVGPNDHALSFLPLSHIFERMGAYFLFASGCCIAYAESIDTVAADMVDVKPTLMMAVPRLYEKIYARVLESAMSGSALKRMIFLWSRATGERWADVMLASRKPGPLLSIQYAIASKLVFSKLRERTGGRLRFFVSGGAPLSPEIARFFYAAGLLVLEGYGLTETAPVISCNTPEAIRIGSVGRPIPGVEIRIADDGEILSRGPNIMKGYFNLPEATAEAIDTDGWFHTGDIGRIDDQFLSITDRKKDIIVTAGGKNIAPQPIENMVRTNKFVSQAVMIGDKRKFPSMLIVPNWDQLEKWAHAQGIPVTSRAEMLQRPDIQAKMEQEVLSHLTGLARFETPKKIALLEHDFTIERGELTPKLSVKRKFIDTAYKHVIDGLYREHIPGD